MAYNMTERISEFTSLDFLMGKQGMKMTEEDRKRLKRYKKNMDFYEGFHWEGIDTGGRPQVTENYVKTFVDKFVSTEMGKGFTIKMLPDIEGIDGENDPLDFLNEVWRDNDKLELLIEIGQSKSITGDSWLQVFYEKPEDRDLRLINGEDYYDPFGEYPEGRIRLTVIPTHEIFPKYRTKGKSRTLEELTIMYPIKTETKVVGVKTGTKDEIYKQVWTRKDIKIYIGDMKKPKHVVPNKYGVIPFVQFKNFPQISSNFGVSDVEDIIPLNVEINTKRSNISEIIDYHSAPITIIFGAKVRQLERGANKIWGGLPRESRVENLKSEGDVSSALAHISSVKRAMHEIGKIPEGVLGGDLAISNTSGVALGMSLAPLLEYVGIKQTFTKENIETVNKVILHIAIEEGLIKIPEGIKKSDYFFNEVLFKEILPKDRVLELQEVQAEMAMGLTSRERAMKQLGKDNIQELIKEIDEDMEKRPSLYGKEDVEKEIEKQEAMADISVDTAKKMQEILPEAPAEIEKPKMTGGAEREGKGMDAKRDVGKNKEGKQAKINAGYTNGPEKKK